MGSWRLIAAVLATLGMTAALAAALISPLLVFPPFAAACLVLITAALVVDYFGVARRREDWAGFAADRKQAWTRARALERRFVRERAAGSPRTGWTARNLLLALAGCDRLEDSKNVVDFLCVDAVYTRVGSDATADALRAIALAELGRCGEATELCDVLADGRTGKFPVVAYAAARVAELGRRPSQALVHVDRALTSRGLHAGARRDLKLLQARILAARSRHDDATTVLLELVACGYAREVEHLAQRAASQGNTAAARAARAALGQASPYR